MHAFNLFKELGEHPRLAAQGVLCSPVALARALQCWPR